MAPGPEGRGGGSGGPSMPGRGLRACASQGGASSARLQSGLRDGSVAFQEGGVPSVKATEGGHGCWSCPG